MNVEFVGQLIDSMEDAILKLEQAVSSGKKDEANNLRTFIFDLHRQIDGVLTGGKNVRGS
jgi:hypothetical protein